MNKAKKNYLTWQDIYAEWTNWVQSSDNPETRTISEKMGGYMLLLARNIMQNKRFVGYPQHMKDEMISDGVMKIIKNLKNMKGEYKESFFAYWTRCVFTAAFVYLSNYYKEKNRKKEMIKDALLDAQDRVQYSSASAYYIKMLEQELEQYADSEKNMPIT